MLRLGTLLTRSLALAALCALALAACGSQRATSTTTTTTGAKATDASSETLDIYSSLPHNGPQQAESRQIEQGIRFALAQAQEHHWLDSGHVRYTALSDSTPQRSSRDVPGEEEGALIPSHGWNATASITSALQAARDLHTVAFIGDLDSGATQLSLPILNQAGIVQLTPGSGYPGLTEQVASPVGVTQPGEPAKYYPQSRLTGSSLLRLTPPTWYRRRPLSNGSRRTPAVIRSPPRRWTRATPRRLRWSPRSREPRSFTD